jgi:hypothetical protein
MYYGNKILEELVARSIKIYIKTTIKNYSKFTASLILDSREILSLIGQFGGSPQIDLNRMSPSYLLKANNKAFCIIVVNAAPLFSAKCGGGEGLAHISTSFYEASLAVFP